MSYHDGEIVMLKTGNYWWTDTIVEGNKYDNLVGNMVLNFKSHICTKIIHKKHLSSEIQN